MRWLSVEQRPRPVEEKIMALSLPRLASRMDRETLAAWQGSFAANAEPLGLARPRSADDVVELMRWAARGKVPVAPFSSAPVPHLRRTQVQVPSLYLDMSGMNRIAHIDRRDRVAVVEAGVTFDALDTALAPHGLRAFRPLRPRAGKSVLASYLDREPFLQVSQQWDVVDPIGGGEIVFGSGETFRTGSASGPWPRDEMWNAGVRFLTAIGPVVTDFMRVVQGSQGTLGVVPWAAVLCDILPPLSRAFVIGAETPGGLVRLCTRLLRRRMGGAIFIANRAQLAALLAAPAEGLPAWALLVELDARPELPEAQMAYETADLADEARAEGLELDETIGGMPARTLISGAAGGTTADYRDQAKGGHRSVFFLSTLDKLAEFAALGDEVCSGTPWAGNFALYVQPRLQGRNCHIEFVIPLDPADSAQAAQADALASRLAEACAARGAFFSRPYGKWNRLVQQANTALRPYLDRTKDLFDPHGILNPGRFSAAVSA
jgi:FAD/FMN-containing dehydrogenase